MRIIIGIIFAFVLSNSYAISYQYGVPDSSGLKFSKQNEGYVLVGAHVLSGRYEFHYDENSIYSKKSYMFFFPDEESLQTLPYLIRNEINERDEALFVRDVEKAAAQLLSPEVEKKYYSGELAIITGEATAVLKELWIGYECDSPTYVAEEISFKLAVATNSPKVARSGC